MLSCVYLTRACPHKCSYCALRDSPLQRPELTTEEWIDAFDILHSLGVDFHLLLGNELLMRRDIVQIISYLSSTGVPYAFYTTCPSYLMKQHAQRLVDVGLSNASCGIDVTPESYWPGSDIYIERKAKSGLEGLKWFRDKGVSDLQGTITISKINTGRLAEVIQMLTNEKIWCGANTIHWDVDGGFDFFPVREKIEHLLLTQKEISRDAEHVRSLYLAGELALQNPLEYWDAWEEHGVDLSWHCGPPQILTVDADGSMRCCGYRKGIHSSNMHIFDLPKQLDNYWDAWYKDQRDCPGCFWSYPWMAEHLLIKESDVDYGLGVFQTHASRAYDMAC